VEGLLGVDVVDVVVPDLWEGVESRVIRPCMVMAGDVDVVVPDRIPELPIWIPEVPEPRRPGRCRLEGGEEDVARPLHRIRGTLSELQAGHLRAVDPLKLLHGLADFSIEFLLVSGHLR